MSDEQAPSRATGETGADDDAETTGASDSLEPGGGPQRVVSEQSVDDILDSLDATEPEPAESDGVTAEAAEPSDAGDAVVTEFDEDDVADADGPTADADADTPDHPEATDERAENEPDSADSPSVDAAASSLSADATDASLEELAARVEDGTVTGADVRAAEAGEGRESTPEIDEVDLSLDDLETASGTSTTGDDWPDDAGPLAGSIDGGASSDGGDGGEDDGAGLFGRLKRFFSR
ncbi:hypothetical protein [Natrinema marinum]|uniref:hypothetical protein n=1 Tax=Natrinema marinum TaxID=2961598 RepID=UPI0020C92706|nr:hypothetical protein [Natrinema marinum]